MLLVTHYLPLQDFMFASCSHFVNCEYCGSLSQMLISKLDLENSQINCTLLHLILQNMMWAKLKKCGKSDV